MHKVVVITIFTLLLLLMSSCSALRNVRRVEQVDSVFVDRTTTAVRDTMVQVVNQVITQTIVEYYPVFDTTDVEKPAEAERTEALASDEGLVPAAATKPAKPTDNKSVPLDTKSIQQSAPAPASKPRVQQQIKSITRTEIRTDAAATAVRDSITKKDITAEIETKTEESVKEKTPISLRAFIWTTIFLIALAMLLIICRLPKRRF